PGGNGVGTHDVWFDVHSPAGRLGNAVGSALSDCPLWVPASAFYPSARCNAVCGVTEGAHRPRIPLFPDVHCSLWGDLVSHADREGRNPEADGAVEHSATEGRIHRTKLVASRTRQPSRASSTKGAAMTATRVEHDSLGPVNVPCD